MSFRQRLLLPLVVGLCLTGCDQVTKGWATHTLKGAPKTLISGVLDLRYTENHDVAFSLLRAVSPRVRRPLVLGLQLTAAALMLWLLITRGPRTRLGQLGAAAIGAGAVGNIADRLLRGAVVDFIHLHGWPIFNGADVFIVVGAALLAIALLREGRHRPPTASA